MGGKPQYPRRDPPMQGTVDGTRRESGATQEKLSSSAERYNHSSMGKLFEQIRSAVALDRFFVAWHADERCEERQITAWQLVAGLADAELVRERPRSKPNPSVVVRQILEDGTEVEVIWSWLSATHQAKLVTVFLVE